VQKIPRKLEASSESETCSKADARKSHVYRKSFTSRVAKHLLKTFYAGDSKTIAAVGGVLMLSAALSDTAQTLLTVFGLTIV